MLALGAMTKGHAPIGARMFLELPLILTCENEHEGGRRGAPEFSVVLTSKAPTGTILDPNIHSCQSHV